MRISVLVPSYQRPDFLARCLASLAQQRRPADEIFVVVRPTDHGTQAMVETQRALFPAGQLHQIEVTEPGIVAAENRGLAAATGDIVALIDDDAEAPEDWLERIAAHYADPKVAAAGGPCVPVVDGVPRFQPTQAPCLEKTWYGSHIGNDETIPEGLRHVHFLRGCNLTFRRALVPSFDVRLKPYWRRFEDDALFPLHLRGLTIVYDPQAYVLHHSAPVREGQRHLDPVSIHGSHHNDVYVFLKHAPPWRCVAYLLFTFLVGDRHNHGLAGYLAKAVVKQCPRRAAQECWHALRGKVDGIRTWWQWRAEAANAKNT